MFLNGQYTPVACPFDRISCQLTTNFPLHVHALFFPIFPSLFTHLFTPYWQSPPNTLVSIIMRNPPWYFRSQLRLQSLLQFLFLLYALYVSLLPLFQVPLHLLSDHLSLVYLLFTEIASTKCCNTFLENF